MHSILSHCTNSIHSIAGDIHHSASPMGLWLLLAVASSATQRDSPDRKEVEKALGMPSEQALCVVEELLDGPGDASSPVTKALKSAMALWLREDSLSGLRTWANQFGIEINDDEQDEDLYAWSDSLPYVVETGPMPTNDEADAWVVEKTDGLLTHLPIEIQPHTFLVLLSAIATKTKWREPFREVKNNGMVSGFFKDDSKVLISADSHDVYIEDTEIGMVGVHVAHGTNGLDVYSVIAEPSASYLDVIRVAHEISEEDRGENRGVPLHQLETEASEIYQVNKIKSSRGDYRVAYLPSWKTQNSLSDLQNDKSLGFGYIADAIALRAGIDPTEADVIVQQDVVAEYTATGFEAAAVTEMTMRIGAVSVPVLKDALKLEVPFDHPYAVVAVVRDRSSWTGTPIFSSWVKEVL
jgi:serine protease inhibitor